MGENGQFGQNSRNFFSFGRIDPLSGLLLIKVFKFLFQHYEGLSSDDEISSLDQANLGKSRSDIENQVLTLPHF